MPTVYFGRYAPDAAELNSGNLVTAKGVLIAGGAPRFHYEPLKDLDAYSSGALDNICLGAVSVRLTDGTTAIFAGDSGKLYKLAADRTWTDFSKSGGYSVTDGEFWWAVYWNNKLLMGSGNVAPQTLNVDSGSQFADLSGSPPTARYATVIGPHLMLGSLSSAPQDIQWSAAADETTWTTGGGSAGGTQSFTEGGWVRGVTGGRLAGYIFQEWRIRRAVYTQDDSHFQFDVVVRDVGLQAPWSLVTIGAQHFFLSHDGFYRFDGQTLTPIGRGKIDNTFLNSVDDNLILSTYGAIDPNDTKVYWLYWTASNTGTTANQCVVYDYHRDEWTGPHDVAGSVIIPAIPLGITLDGLDSAFPSYNMDTLPFSLDSRALQGVLPSLAVFGTDKKMSTFTSSNVAATIKTAQSEVVPGRRADIINTRALVDNSAATVQLGHRERLADTVTNGPAVSQETNGDCPQRASGRYFEATMAIPAGETWTQAHGVDFDAIDGGEI